MLNALLDLEQLDHNRFQAHAHQPSFRHSLFGGQVLAQALVAAGHTVKGRPVHSLHSYFLKSGHVNSSITYEVEFIRDGRSVSNRLVRAHQDDQLLLILNASFHQQEAGYEHQLTAPGERQEPEHLQKQFSQLDSAHLARVSQGLAQAPIDFIPFSKDLFETSKSDEHRARFWFRSNSRLTNSALHHYGALTFASDIGLLASALLPHETSLFSDKIFPASIDHSMWFHRQPNFNEWHQYITKSPWAGNARALCRGAIYDMADRLVASTAQEGLIRQR